jgi:hypothetical protein
MNHAYLAAKFREGWLLSDGWRICYLLIVVLCLSDVAPVNAQTRVAPPPRLGIRETLGQVQPPPPIERRQRSITPSPDSRQTPAGRGKHSTWFNVGVITAIAGLITALAGLVAAFAAFRKS